jgi:hypothetical protein
MSRPARSIAAALAALAALLLALPAAAQEPGFSPAQPEIRTLVLRAGTLVPMATVERLSSKRAHQGQRVALEVTEDVLVDGRIVIRRGARAVGEVARVVEKGVLGKSGKLRIRAMFIDLGGSRIRLDGEAHDRGRSGAAPVVGAAVLIGVSGAFISGTSAVLPPGSPIDGRVFQDVRLILRSASAPAPIRL